MPCRLVELSCRAELLHVHGWACRSPFTNIWTFLSLLRIGVYFPNRTAAAHYTKHSCMQSMQSTLEASQLQLLWRK